MQLKYLYSLHHPVCLAKVLQVDPKLGSLTERPLPKTNTPFRSGAVALSNYPSTTLAGHKTDSRKDYTSFYIYQFKMLIKESHQDVPTQAGGTMSKRQTCVIRKRVR